MAVESMCHLAQCAEMNPFAVKAICITIEAATLPYNGSDWEAEIVF